MKVQTFRDALRALSQFHENEKLVARVQTWKAVTWLTPKRRRLILSLGAIMASMMGFLHRHADWSDYLIPATWLLVCLAAPLRS